MDEILSRPEFREPPQSLYDRIVSFIGDLLDETLGALLGGGRDSLLAWILLVAFIGALVFTWVKFAPTLRRDPQGREDATDLERTRPSVDWLAEAEQFAAAARWRDAVRCRYRALVAALAERGLIEDIPGRTAGEYRNVVFAAAPAASADFSHASDMFEVAWYGDRTTAEQFGSIANLSQRVLAAADQ